MTRLRLTARALADLLWPLLLGLAVTLVGLVLVERGLEVARTRRDNVILQAEVERLESRVQALQGILRRESRAPRKLVR